MEGAGGAADGDDVDVIAGVNDAGRVLGAGHGSLRRRWPWGVVKRLRRLDFPAARRHRSEAASMRERPPVEGRQRVVNGI